MASDYREIIRGELLRRIGRNPLYSARAFARDLEVSPAFLSQVMSRKRRLSESRAHHLVERMNLPPSQRQRFVGTVRLELARDSRARSAILKELQNEMSSPSQEMAEAVFSTVAEWYHFAIVELVDVVGFRSDPAWISRRLGIPVQQTKLAIERLIHVGLLKHERGSLKKCSPNYEVKDIPSSAVRSFHRQHLQNAFRAIDDQRFEDRVFTGCSLAIDPERLPEARKLISECLQKVQETLGAGPRHQVYHLAVQFYRLDQAKKRKKR